LLAYIKAWFDTITLFILTRFIFYFFVCSIFHDLYQVLQYSIRAMASTLNILHCMFFSNLRCINFSISRENFDNLLFSYFSIFLLLFQISFFNFYKIYQSVRVFIGKCSETVTNFLCLFSLSYFPYHPSFHVHSVQGLLLFYNVVGGVNTIGIVVKPLLCG
jgi:hypothetical protein